MESKISQRPRIIVVLEPHPQMVRLLRAAKRRAEEHRLDWEALLVETPHMGRRYTPAEQEQMLASLTQAEQMGAIVTKVSAINMVQGVKDVVNERLEKDISIHSVIVANIHNAKRGWLRAKPLASRLKPQLDNVTVTKINVGEEASNQQWIFNLLRVNGQDILYSLSAVLAATVLIQMIDMVVPEAIGYHNRNKSIIYIIACAFAAGRYGLLAGIITSVVSFLVLNFMYMAPKYALVIDDKTDAVNLALFLLAAIVISLLGSRDLSGRLALAKRADRLASLLSIHRNTLSKETPEDAIKTLDRQLSDLLETDTAFFLPSTIDKYILETLFIKDITLSDADEKAMQLCWTELKPAGVGTIECPEGCAWRFEPLVTMDGAVGVLGVEVRKNIELDINFGRLLSGIADQAALILEQLQLKQTTQETKIQAEKEKLRAMLLSSVSHDLKTPLASVIGSLSVYRGMRDKLPENKRATLISTALEEAQRLDSFITNILDMTRIESGEVKFKKEWVKPKQMIKSVSRRLKDRLGNHQLNIIGGEDVEVEMDSMMTGQVVQNLLDNAAKYTKVGTQIDISWRVDTQFHLMIRDHGAGIPEHKLDKVFNKYERLQKQDSQVAGTGLGLAIAKAVMISQNGDVVACNHPDGGALFTLTLPTWRKDEIKEVA